MLTMSTIVDIVHNVDTYWHCWQCKGKDGEEAFHIEIGMEDEVIWRWIFLLLLFLFWWIIVQRGGNSESVLQVGCCKWWNSEQGGARMAIEIFDLNWFWFFIKGQSWWRDQLFIWRLVLFHVSLPSVITVLFSFVSGFTVTTMAGFWRLAIKH